MALAYPPDGWTVKDTYNPTESVWGTNIVESTSVKLAGVRSLHYPANALTDWVQINGDGYMPAEPSGWYRGWGAFYASHNGVDHVFQATTNYYNASFTYVGQSNFIQAAAAATSTWERFSAVLQAPATAVWMRPALWKKNGSPDWDLYVDHFQVRKAAPGWRVANTGAQAIPTSIITAMTYGTPAFIRGAVQTTSSLFTFSDPGLYTLGATAGFYTALGDQDVCDVFYRISGGGWLRVAGGPQSGTTASEPWINFSDTIEINSGDTLEFGIFHNYGSNRTCSGFSYAARVD